MSHKGPILSFSDVVARRWDGGRELRVLDRVSFEVDAGTLVGLYGPRRAGKTTLLRLAAGFDLADEGVVRVAGADLATIPTIERAALLRGTVALMAPESWRPRPHETVIDHLVLTLGSTSLTVAEARRRAHGVLDEVGMAGAGLEPATALAMAERVNLLLAGALVHEPRLLLVDEPCVIPSLAGRDRFLALVREMARARDMAVIVASEELAAVQGASVVMSLSFGQITSTDERGVVVSFPGRQRASVERAGA
jgi:ABC-type multidrug transport system ATPase subunit